MSVWNNSAWREYLIIINSADAMAMRYMYFLLKTNNYGSITAMTVRQLFMIVNDSLKNFTLKFKVSFNFYMILVYFAWWNCASPCLSLRIEKFYSLLGLESRYVGKAESVSCLVLFCFRIYC